MQIVDKSGEGPSRVFGVTVPAKDLAERLEARIGGLKSSVNPWHRVSVEVWQVGGTVTDTVTGTVLNCYGEPAPARVAGLLVRDTG